MSTVHLPRRRGLARAGVVSLAALAAGSLGLSTASAAPDLTIALDPPELLLDPIPVENLGLTDLVSDEPGSDELLPVPAQYTGTVDIALPGDLDATDSVVTLDVAADLETAPTASYSSEDTTSPLLVNADADGLTVTLPADDGTSGPIGLLSVDGLTTAVDGAEVAPLWYVLDLDPTVPDPAAQLAPQLFAFGSVPCALSSDAPCPAYTTQAGSSLTLTVPADSSLQQVGLGTLENLQVVLSPLEDVPTTVVLTGEQVAAAAEDTSAPADQPAAAELAPAQQLADGLADGLDTGIPLTVAAASAGADPTVTLTVPADVAAGDYDLEIWEGNAAVGASVTDAVLHVDAAPAPVAAPVVAPPAAPTTAPAQNVGLRSDTGWIEPAPAEESSSSVLVPVGAGTLLVAGAGIVTVLRTRRRGAGD